MLLFGNKVKLPWEQGCSEHHSVIVTTTLDLAQFLYFAMLNTLKSKKRHLHSAMLVYIFINSSNSFSWNFKSFMSSLEKKLTRKINTTIVHACL